jgi:hypothetical protein
MDFRELREQLTDEMLKDILAQFNVEPCWENETEIVFPTCCHNFEGGSPKLFYYKNSKLFHCYTECAASFDIFTLLQKMYELRGQTITLRQAIEVCSLDSSLISNIDKDESCIDDIKYMQELNDTYIPNVDNLDFKTYDPTVLRRYSFDYMGLMPWIEEGISIESLQKFNIKYDSYNQAIIIPNFDYEGKLIGLRGRYFRPHDIAKGKYRPIYNNGVLYNHPTGRTFYGIYENHKNIERKHIAIIFEGEKSVLKMDSIYDKNNISVAVYGQKISRKHIKLLIDAGVSNVVLAFDADYKTIQEAQQKFEEYKRIAKPLTTYFTVSIIMDFKGRLDYKDAPIDKGEKIFNELMKERIYIW